ncbi:MAG: serine hydrolase [Lachnospiraceae bacterium]|nr:serine hydrolase [Lachnospiraceae bacterium]
MRELEKVTQRIREFPGKAGFYYKNLATGECAGYRAREAFYAASVIKLPILAEVFRRMEQGTLDGDKEITLRREDRLPGCGGLQFLHDGVRLTLQDLYYQMIVLSDNTATNLLIKELGGGDAGDGMAAVNALMQELGFGQTRLNRLLFDAEASSRGIENTIGPEEMGVLLERIHQGCLVSKTASEAMLSILEEQQLNSKIPFYLRDVRIAHKTGEDDGITHDVGIIYAKEPFVLCLCGNEVDTADMERMMQEVSLELYRMVQKEAGK